MNKPNVSEQIDARKNGLAPSQLNRQKTPIWGVGLADGQAPTSLTHPLTWRLYHHDALLTLADYEALDGFVGLKNALTKSPKEVGEMIKTANVRGRGGAGFNAGLKWTFMTPPDGGVRYLICNADEMEPGTFKDRLLMERLPFQLIEGMLISAYAIGASVGYVFIRGEYVLAAKRLQNAINECVANHLLGDGILGTEFNFTLHVHTGAGRYICGEETALINCLEGRRANPRTKPPFPQVSGAWGRPTVVNNVETLNNMPAILLNGVDWYLNLPKAKGKSTTPGTKIMGVSGRVKDAGLWELPFGHTARELIELAGGMQEGLSLKAWLPGGASTDFLTASDEHLDLVMDFDPIMKAGSRLGTCLMMVVDESQDMVSLSKNLQQFFQRESCGWCTPCRDGLPWGVKILDAMDNGQAQADDIDKLSELTRDLWLGKTFCAHAPGAMEPLMSALKYFRHEFEQKVNNSKPQQNKVGV
ncbi:NADH oxidoreductase (quinone) subunit F [Moraxella catarrhalis]|uniref:NADH-quinone oxidoreductase subunit F n=1 Tax=Moraxella catarrhalis TaxID=480 RepID=A0A3A9M9V3_MORCA|nr:NADH-quinone oxidoreductase subunit NuoF [Moraxella catarrhalis]AZQ92953.1 NADH oxidoreductase (quinone), F subunit [Moraxella catarrhalis]AZQ95827.1 NADH oxidoreductase (quinone), F subunit [Moraxella catarrhalis]EGE26916.1 NADH-quinone oxidoreductase subunit F [Moraxella catarrhalis 101P30B1]MPW67083.1 NADH oxidoreductase (quinone) subunit F [Moraxella catarrhalis]MPW68677.1 NADH oxidoreductase (quinone) subunit F [Moraxella catarrhalis]